METVKLPKKFKDICEEIRDGKEEALEKLKNYSGFENQKKCVLAEIAYFKCNFEEALKLDLEICPFWNEWNYSNVREEHVAAMSFVARLIKKEKETISFFEKMIDEIEKDKNSPNHVKNTQIFYYKKSIEYIKLGNMDFFHDNEYKANENPMSLEDITEAVKKENKKIDMESDKALKYIFNKSIKNGSLETIFSCYDKVKDMNLDTAQHIDALSAYLYKKDTEKAFEIVLRMAGQRLWSVASPTQVRPMEFFRHSLITPFLSDIKYLKEIERFSQRL